MGQEPGPWLRVAPGLGLGPALALAKPVPALLELMQTAARLKWLGTWRTSSLTCGNRQTHASFSSWTRWLQLWTCRRRQSFEFCACERPPVGSSVGD